MDSGDSGPREKRPGFGMAHTEHRTATPVYETPNYRVIVGQLSTGPADHPPELRVRYVVVGKRHPVVAGHSGIEGEAIIMAIRAEAMLAEARTAAAEAAAQNYSPPQEPASATPPKLAWPELPR